MFESYLKPPISFPTLTGSIVTFNSQYAGLPLPSCKIAVNGWQEGTGTPSPDNVRPLVSFSSGSLSATGKNLIDLGIDYIKTINTAGTWNGNDYTHNNIVFSCTVDERGEITSITANGTANGRADIIIKKQQSNLNKILKNGVEYIANGSIGGTESTYGIFIGDNITATYRATNGDFSFTPNQALIDNNYYIRVSVISGTVMNNIVFYPMLRVTGDNIFEPYNGNTYTFTFGQSIYQGYIDWERGVVTAKWGYIASYNGETLTGEWLCNKAPYEVGTTPPTASQVAYELATPIEIPLGGINLLTQQGVNNIFADTGDTTLQYIKFG